MGWNGFKIFNRWGSLSPFRVTPHWKEGVDEKNGFWFESVQGAYHWEEETTRLEVLGTVVFIPTGIFKKVSGDLFVEIEDYEPTGQFDLNYDPITRYDDLYVGRFPEQDDGTDTYTHYDIGDHYLNDYGVVGNGLNNIVIDIAEYNHFLVTVPGFGDVTLVDVKLVVAKKKVTWNFYKFEFGEWHFVREEHKTAN
ncbi:MAG: hypothetical protein KBF93_19000 [Leptospiraceae bacterium]|nr:hypothetical protein [Leptospiraceae bacterium]